MINNPPENNEIDQFTWPIDILYRKGVFYGYVMSRLKRGTINLNKIYEPSRRKGIPWNYYIHIAKNLCLAVNALHSCGYAIGDLNPNNIVVDDNGIVMLVDTDSYRIVDENNNEYRCPVGMGMYLPRELQGINFGTASLPTFTEESDLFALAVLIFCLLMNGAHPHACTINSNISSSTSFQPIDNIRNGVSPYFSKTTGIGIPEYAPKMVALTRELQKLFYKVFVDGHHNTKIRPKVLSWYNALEDLEKQIVRCKKDKSHYHYSGVSNCPWCDVEARCEKSNQSKQSSYSGSIPINTPIPITITHSQGTTFAKALPNINSKPSTRNLSKRNPFSNTHKNQAAMLNNNKRVNLQTSNNPHKVEGLSRKYLVWLVASIISTFLSIFCIISIITVLVSIYQNSKMMTFKAEKTLKITKGIIISGIGLRLIIRFIF